jgi:hypothetical protein
MHVRNAREKAPDVHSHQDSSTKVHRDVAQERPSLNASAEVLRKWYRPQQVLLHLFLQNFQYPRRIVNDALFARFEFLLEGANSVLFREGFVVSASTIGDVADLIPCTT